MWDERILIVGVNFHIFRALANSNSFLYIEILNLSWFHDHDYCNMVFYNANNQGILLLERGLRSSRHLL